MLQAYIPAVPGKEPRKPEPGKEGLLGVEGVDDALILQGLHTACLLYTSVGGWHAAASAGKLILAEPVEVDLYCAGGSCPEAIQAKAILCNQQTPKWLSKAGDTPVSVSYTHL